MPSISQSLQWQYVDPLSIYQFLLTYPLSQLTWAYNRRFKKKLKALRQNQNKHQLIGVSMGAYNRVAKFLEFNGQILLTTEWASRRVFPIVLFILSRCESYHIQSASSPQVIQLRVCARSAWISINLCEYFDRFAGDAWPPRKPVFPHYPQLKAVPFNCPVHCAVQ